MVALIDARLAIGETDGWHYQDLPEDGQAWRDTLRLLDEDAVAAGAQTFAAASRQQQGGILQHVQDLDSAQWHGMPAQQVWSLWTRYACTAFYSHPWSWNEIGFGGPAYPRGYKARHVGAKERWEVSDHDDTDPVPFAQRIERARRRQENPAGEA